MVGLRESTWELRVITGTLFGLANMWFALPFVQKTLTESLASSLPTMAPVIQPSQPASAMSTAFLNGPAVSPEHSVSATVERVPVSEEVPENRPEAASSGKASMRSEE